jgi:MurNAc alpha-1-phosphate uridylyltransferase
MVLAAGHGKRLRPLTIDTPKPLVRVAGKPLIDYALDRFVAAGVTKAVVNVHYLADQLEAHVTRRGDLSVIVSDERDQLLETGGGLKKALAHLGQDPVFCTNTDAILIDEDGPEACAVLAAHWDVEKMDALLLLVPGDRASGYAGAGDFDRDETGRIAFRSEATAPFIFTGLQIISPALIGEGPDGPFSTKLLWDAALARGRLYGVVHEGSWLHVGDPAGLVTAEERLKDGSS